MGSGFRIAKPVVLPRGTRLLGISHFDNSANNAFNPDPSKEIVWGLQNWDEMQSSFLGFLIPANTDISQVLKASGPSLKPRPQTGPGPSLSMVELPK